MKGSASTRHFLSLRTVLAAFISLAILGLIVAYVRPDELGQALSRFNLAYLPLVLLLSLTYYLIKGYQWHLFLKPLKLDHGALETILIYFAGQPTAILPLGELSRAFILRQHAKVSLGEVSATVVVQELLYPIGLIAAAVPGAGRIPGAQEAVVVALLGIMGISTILLWPRGFNLVMHFAVKVPIVRRYSADLVALHRDVILIARRPATLWPALLGPVAAVTAIAMFYLHRPERRGESRGLPGGIRLRHRQPRRGDQPPPRWDRRVRRLDDLSVGGLRPRYTGGRRDRNSRTGPSTGSWSPW